MRVSDGEISTRARRNISGAKQLIWSRADATRLVAIAAIWMACKNPIADCVADVDIT
jgi:hypothetical protein